MGRKKLEYSFVVGEFLKGGCVLLAETYVNNKTLMRYICNCENESRITYGGFKEGHRCSKCGKSEKLIIEFVKEQFLKAGCKLLETVYINSKSLMRYICNCGEESEIRYYDFKSGHRCSKCGGSEKLTIEFVKQEFLKAGCKLLETVYVNVRTLMRYICSCGNESKITYGNFSQGNRCANCGGKNKLTIGFVKEFFSKAGCVLLETIYVNARTLMRYICDCGNESKITYDSFRQGHRCSICRNKTERIVKDFLEEKYSNIISQQKFEWCKNKFLLPFDFLLDDLNIIIEVDGPQHFIQVSNWRNPEETLKRDIFKTKAAIERGYSVIRISQADIFDNSIAWQNLLKENIKEYLQPTCVYISKDPELYNKHKALLE